MTMTPFEMDATGQTPSELGELCMAVPTAAMHPWSQWRGCGASSKGDVIHNGTIYPLCAIHLRKWCDAYAKDPVNGTRDLAAKWRWT